MDSSKLQHDLKLLIDKKIHMYPDIKRTITKIEINETDNDYKISAESEEFKMEK
jgi:hypothetical protein